MITKETQVLFSVKEQGAIKRIVDLVGKKKLKVKFQKYPFMKKNKKGIVMGSYDGKTWEKAKLAPQAPIHKIEYHEVITKTTIPETAVQYFISEEGKVPGISIKQWKQMSDEARLEANLAINANGKEFTYELVN